jgi:ubiquinone/menaquinone biosynthesis C-methylase UbiE
LNAVPEQQNKVLLGWQASAKYWNKYRALITQMFSPLTDGLVDEARIRTGQSVLDIGGGSGEPSLTLARVVGPSGSITFTDPALGMVEAARNEAVRRGLTNIRFHQCSADDLPFANATFDVVIGRLSAMFFSDPLKSVAETLRVVVEDGRIAFVVWAAKEANPFFSTVNNVVDRFADSVPEDPEAPSAFRFAAPGKMAAILRRAGAGNVTERNLKFRIEAAISVEEFWQLRTEMSETVREQLAKIDVAQLPIIKQAVAEVAQKYFVGKTMNFPAEAWIVAGQRITH